MTKCNGPDRRPPNRLAVVYKQSTATVANTDGGFDELAVEYCSRWVRAKPLKGAELKAMEHDHALVEWIVELRYDTVAAAITTDMWIILPDSQRLNITSVFDPDGRRREIEIRARQAA